MKGELYFLVNPASSSGNGLEVWKQIRLILKEKNISYKSVVLESAGEAAGAVEKIVLGTKSCTIVIVGGDGSVNEAFQALQKLGDLSGVTIGCIPTGSGNDFIRGLGLPFDPAQALEVILESERTRPVDIGLAACEGKQFPFAVSSGIGYDAAVCHNVARTGTKSLLNHLHLGSLAYTLEALKLILTMKPVRMRMELCTEEGETEIVSFRKVWFAAAMNTAYEGGGYRFCPDADPGDGKLDLIVAEGIGRLQVLLLMPGAMRGKHLGKKGIHIFRISAARVKCGSEACVHTDGEPVAVTRLISWKVRGETVQLCC